MSQVPSPSQPSPDENNGRVLFRQQVIESLSSRQYGSVVLASNASYRALTLLFTGIVLVLIAFFFTFDVTRKAQAPGVLLPASGVVAVMATQQGVVVEKRAVNGQRVRAGEVLFVLENVRSLSNGKSTEKTFEILLMRRRDSINSELRQVELQAAERRENAINRMKKAEVEMKQLAEQINLQEKIVTFAEKARDRFLDLRPGGYVSEAQVQDKQAEVMAQGQRLAEIARLKSNGEREYLNVRTELRQIELQAKREAAALQRASVELEQDLAANTAQREIIVRAPLDGTITDVNADLGQSVDMRARLAAILPADSPLEAEIYLPSRSIGFLKKGGVVFLRFQSYPYQKFGQHPATVKEISGTSILPAEVSGLGGALAEPMYRVRLSLARQTINVYGRSLSLKPGMVIEASIALDKRRLYEWVIEPFSTIAAFG